MSEQAVLWANKQHILRVHAHRLLTSMAENEMQDETDPENLKKTKVVGLINDFKNRTGMDRKTVISCFKYLKLHGYIEDTNERAGATRRIIIYRLLRSTADAVDRMALQVNAETQSEINALNMPNDATGNAFEDKFNTLVAKYPKKQKHFKEPAKYDVMLKCARNELAALPYNDEKFWAKLMIDMDTRLKIGGEWTSIDPLYMEWLHTYLKDIKAGKWANTAKKAVSRRDKPLNVSHRPFKAKKSNLHKMMF